MQPGMSQPPSITTANIPAPPATCPSWQQSACRHPQGAKVILRCTASTSTFNLTHLNLTRESCFIWEPWIFPKKKRLLNQFEWWAAAAAADEKGPSPAVALSTVRQEIGHRHLKMFDIYKRLWAQQLTMTIPKEKWAFSVGRLQNTRQAKHYFTWVSLPTGELTTGRQPVCLSAVSCRLLNHGKDFQFYYYYNYYFTH